MAGTALLSVLGAALALLPALSLPGAAAVLPEQDRTADVSRLVYSLMQRDLSAMASAFVHDGLLEDVSAMLGRGDDVTLLAPTDAAFQSFNGSACGRFMKAALKHHIVLGRNLGEQLENAPMETQFPTLSGFVLVKVEEKPLKLAVSPKLTLPKTARPLLMPMIGAHVTLSQLNAHVSRNIVVHIVDEILHDTCRPLPRLSQQNFPKMQQLGGGSKSN